MVKINLGVIGAGYVGLTTAVCLADIGHKIFLYDIDDSKIDSITKKQVPFFEKDLEHFLLKTISKGTLVIANSMEQLIKNTEGCFVCVGTPSKKDGKINLTQIESSVISLANSIANTEKENYVIIIRSTVLPGTTRKIVYPILAKKLSRFGLCSIPEFLQEGQAIHDFMNMDKLVIGHIDKNSLKFAENIFSFFLDKTFVFRVNLETAELIKYTNNAFFSTLISFSNEISNIADTLHNVDAFEVLNALAKDKRITIRKNKEYITPPMVSYLLPGCGFGGSCLPKDMKAILAYAKSNRIKTPLLEATMRINEERADILISKTESICGSLKDKKIAILGLAFKPDTDDIRSSPSIEAIKILIQRGAKLECYDPMVKKESIINLGLDVTIHFNLEECIKNTDLIILFTKWPEFKKLSSNFLKKYMTKPLVIDGRGYLKETNFEQGTYYKIGYSSTN